MDKVEIEQEDQDKQEEKVQKVVIKKKKVD